MRFRQSDERLELSGEGGDLAAAGADLPHAHVVLYEERAGLLGQLGAGELALGVAKVVPQDTHVQLFVLRRLGRPVAGYIVQIKSNKLIEVTSCGKVVL